MLNVSIADCYTEDNKALQSLDRTIDLNAWFFYDAYAQDTLLSKFNKYQISLAYLAIILPSLLIIQNRSLFTSVDENIFLKMFSVSMNHFSKEFSLNSHSSSLK